MSGQYAKLIRNHTIGGAAVGAALGGASVGLNTHLSNVGKDKKKKKSVLGRAAAGALGGAALGGALFRHNAKSQIDAHEAMNKAREQWQRSKFEQAHRASGGKGDWNYHSFSRTKPAPDLDQHLGFLGVSKNAKTKKEVSQKYKDLAMKHHPDRGGDSQKMKDVNEAYDKIKKSDWFDKLGFAIGFSKIHNF